MNQLESKFCRYWCEGETCACTRTHWVIHARDTNCWECMHDPCACRPPLFWDSDEKAYYSLFLSSDGKTKTTIWMGEPLGDMAKIDYKRGEKKRKELVKKEKEEDECTTNQQNAQQQGFSCYHHAKRMKKEKEEEKIGEKQCEVIE